MMTIFKSAKRGHMAAVIRCELQVLQERISGVCCSMQILSGFILLQMSRKRETVLLAKRK